MLFRSRILIRTGDIVRGHGGWILVALLCIGLVAHRGLHQPDIRLAVERVLHRLPIAGLLIRRVQAARFARTLGTLLRNGVGLVAALGIGRDVLENLTAVRIVDRAVAKVKAGERLAGALAEHRFFPVQTIHLLQIGEETGKLADVIAIRTDRPRQVPMYDPVSHLVYTTHGDDVVLTIVNGQVLMRDGVVKTLDEAQVIKDARAAADQVRKAVQ